MAIKASATITLTAIKDIDSVYWFYKLQASTATPPTKAKMVKPSSKGGVPTDTTGVSGSWTSSEPAYTSGDTKTLYCVELTYYTDGTSEFSEVSVSSSYEAAKQAYNKAQNAETLAVNGAKVATNYLTDITDGGISVHPMGATSDRAIINGEGLEIFKDDVSVAKFGETVRIGVDDGTQSHQVLDYHSLQLIDKEGTAYFYASDLRDKNGIAEVTCSFKGDGETTYFAFPVPVPQAYLDYTVTVSDGSGGAVTRRESGVSFETPPTDGATITATVKTKSSVAKAYTLGIRGSGTIGVMSVASGTRSVASGACSHAEGIETVASGNHSHAEGEHSKAYGDNSHAECRSTAEGQYSHSEGWLSEATGKGSHAEGWDTVASGKFSHAEGWMSEATGEYSHAENKSNASGGYSHAEGFATQAQGENSHAEGYQTYAQGEMSHAGGHWTYATKKCQTAIGRYNVADTNESDDYGEYAFIIGNGESSSARSNALAVTWDGDVEFAVNTSATTGVDADLYSALSALGWE